MAEVDALLELPLGVDDGRAVEASGVLRPLQELPPGDHRLERTPGGIHRNDLDIHPGL